MFHSVFVGVFIAKNDVGVGTIVGSAVFNILFIIGTCSIFAGMVRNSTVHVGGFLCSCCALF
jgi:Ca2+/Na+ antiporter